MMGLFETSTFKKKIRAKDVTLLIENGEPVFHVLLCISLKNGDKREFSEKDLGKVAKIKFHIERHELPWWEIKEESDAFWLYYYPKRFRECHECNFAYRLGSIVEGFNDWLR